MEPLPIYLVNDKPHTEDELIDKACFESKAYSQRSLHFTSEAARALREQGFTVCRNPDYLP